MNKRQLLQAAKAAAKRTEAATGMREIADELGEVAFAELATKSFRAWQVLFARANAAIYAMGPFGGGSLGERALTEALCDRAYFLKLPCRGSRLEAHLLDGDLPVVMQMNLPSAFGFRDHYLPYKKDWAQDALEKSIALEQFFGDREHRVARLVDEAVRDTLFLSDQIANASPPTDPREQLRFMVEFAMMLDELDRAPARRWEARA